MNVVMLQLPRPQMSTSCTCAVDADGEGAALVMLRHCTLLAGTSLWEWLSLGYDHPENQSAQERFPDENKVQKSAHGSLDNKERPGS